MTIAAIKPALVEEDDICAGWRRVCGSDCLVSTTVLLTSIDECVVDVVDVVVDGNVEGGDVVVDVDVDDDIGDAVVGGGNVVVVVCVTVELVDGIVCIVVVAVVLVVDVVVAEVVVLTDGAKVLLFFRVKLKLNNPNVYLGSVTFASWSALKRGQMRTEFAQGDLIVACVSTQSERLTLSFLTTQPLLPS